MLSLLSTELGDLRRFDGFISRATLGIKKAKQFLKNCGIGRVPQERAFTAHSDEFLVLELFEVVRQRGRRNFEFALDLADNHSFWVRRK